MKILIAEDHALLASQLQKILVKQKFSVDVVSDGETAKNYLDVIEYDLFLLDLGLPKIDGLTLCKSLRNAGNSIPILILTGQSQIQDKLLGLNAGGDDYMTKPFDSDELIARVHSLLRRRKLELQPVQHWGALSLNQNLSQIFYENVPLSLTATEYRILALLLLNPQQVFSRQIMIDRIWASTREIPSDETVKSHVKTLRKKLQKFNLGDLIQTVYGVGYCLNTKFQDSLSQSVLPSPFLKAEEAHSSNKGSSKKSVIVYDENCFFDFKAISSPLRSSPLKSFPDIYFEVNVVGFSDMSSLRNHLEHHAPNLLLIVLNQADDYQKVLRKSKEIKSYNASIYWFFITKDQLLNLVDIQSYPEASHFENEQLLPPQYLHHSISFLLASSHAVSLKKNHIFICSTCDSIIDSMKLLLQDSSYTLTIISAFEELWDIQNIILPTVFVIDSQFEDSTGIELCHLLRHNSYFNHVPIAMIGDSRPYVLDEIMQAGIDYFVDRNKMTIELQPFSNWIKRKSYDYQNLT
jgi:DNA-binding response OmpR family regulator